METDFTKGLNPVQKAAVLHTEGPLLLIAGAGSGKTRVIIERIKNIHRMIISADYCLLVIPREDI